MIAPGSVFVEPIGVDSLKMHCDPTVGQDLIQSQIIRIQGSGVSGRRLPNSG